MSIKHVIGIEIDQESFEFIASGMLEFNLLSEVERNAATN
ncbi:hypothetical protein K737_301098 [Holospora undulata HU1]|uniref:Uncharacterized protein n=1 Tax=Holospora undulata HU1 TaxID=1321371 RepID=A0A061JGU1_9PROT|nr:hypothetical protein K737_301098 [Holospora undulata HU1]